MTPARDEPAIARSLRGVLGIERDEIAPVLAGFALFFLLFAAFFMLRPVRETMGITGGVDNLKWMFTATFVFTLVAMPLFGWLASRHARRRVLVHAYAILAAILVAFAAGFLARPEDVWIARGFYVLHSVANLIAVSVAWSVLADVFPLASAKRLFALVASGASVGGLVGPLAAIALVAPIGHAGLVMIAALLVLGAIVASQRLQAWRDRHPLGDVERAGAARGTPLGGSPFAGAIDVFRSPFLLGVAGFVVLLASVNTFLYFEQARLVELTFPDRIRQTQVFGTLDAIVQSLSILAQLFITGHLARRLGVGVLLVAVPLVATAGFVWLAFAPVFAVLAVVIVVRRAGEYAFVRPGREMLFTVVSPEVRFKAKNFIDSVAYRGGDAVSGWLKSALDELAQHAGIVALIGAGVALAWAGTGAWLARASAREDDRLG